MKLRTFLGVFAVMTAQLHADVEISREEAGSIQSYDLDKFTDKAVQLEGKIVKLKFNYRLKDVEKKEDGTLTGDLRIWKYGSGAVGSTYKSGGIAVTVPPEGAGWFLKVPTTESRATLIVIAKIGKSQSGSPSAELLGREIKTDLKGSRIVW